MEACFYGAGCTRPGCIYRHDRSALTAQPKSEEPCMAYLAGYCSFNARSCRKRHPPPAEADRLRQKYSQIRCRYGTECQTEGCLYRHEALTEPIGLLAQSAGTFNMSQPPVPPPHLRSVIPGTSWRPTPPTRSPQSTLLKPVPPQPSCSRPVPPTIPPKPPTLPSTIGQGQQTGVQRQGEFNINAKEFVPGGRYFK
jgi:hypothetical protein